MKNISTPEGQIAFKEKIGSNADDTWQTNLIVYDFTSKNWKRLTAVREAVIYWWRQNKQIELKDYMWDIFPVILRLHRGTAAPPHQPEKERHTMDESNFVVKTIFHARGSSEVLTENYFVTRKEAEEFCALTDYAMKLNYGAEQQLVTTEIVAL